MNEAIQRMLAAGMIGNKTETEDWIEYDVLAKVCPSADWVSMLIHPDGVVEIEANDRDSGPETICSGDANGAEAWIHEAMAKAAPAPLASKISIQTVADAEQCVSSLAKIIGIGFHPDTAAQTYVDVESGVPIFHPAMAAVINARLDACHDLLGETIYDVAEAALQHIISRPSTTANPPPTGER